MFDIFSLLKSVKTYITRKDILVLLGIALAFLVTRLINLDKFPIFSDEGIYIHWAKTAWHDGTLRFISLTDGKQPLQTWGTIPFLKLFSDNLLLGGRLYAVMNGFIGLMGVIVLANYLFGKKAAFWGAMLYILTPYFLFYDRMALVDSGVNAAAIWILFFSILLVNTRRLDIALLFGLVAGIGLLAKSSVRIFLGLALFAPIIIYEKKISTFSKKAINYLILLFGSSVIAYIMYNVQRLSPYMSLVEEKNKTFVMTFSDFFQTPFKYFFRNLELIPWYVFQEAAIIMPILGIIGLIVLFRKNRRLAIYLSLWVIIPFFIVSFLSIVLYPRYIIFMASFLLIPAAYLLSILDKKKLIIAVSIFVLSVIYVDYTMLFAPRNIPFPPIDRSQYLEDWPAGWGVKEIVEYSREKSNEKQVILLAEGNFGMASDSLDSLLKRSDEGKISIWGRWPLNRQDLLDAQKELDNKYVYIVTSQQMSVPTDWPVKLIKKYDKPNNKSTVYFLELLPE